VPSLGDPAQPLVVAAWRTDSAFCWAWGYRPPVTSWLRHIVGAPKQALCWRQSVAARRFCGGHMRRVHSSGSVVPEKAAARSGDPLAQTLPGLVPARGGAKAPGGFSKSASQPLFGDGEPPKDRRRKPKLWGAPSKHLRRQEEDEGPSFIERQQSHAATQARIKFAKLQRHLVAEARSADDVTFLGAQGVEGLRTFLKAKFGSIVNGWRVLDRDKNGLLSFGEFVLGCRKIGFHGNMQSLWSKLDVKKTGAVTIMEICPDTGHYIGTFKAALMKEYGDMLTAWRKGIDTNKSGRIEEKELRACCERLGLSLDAGKLFDLLRSGPKELGLSLEQFDPESFRRMITSDVDGPTTKKIDLDYGDVTRPLDVTSTPLKSNTKKWRQLMMQKDRLVMNQMLDDRLMWHAGLQSVDDLKKMLVLRCRSLFAAWRRVLDLDGNGRLTFGEFSLGLSRLQFYGDLKGLWKLLVLPGRDYVEFKDLDPETDALLSDFNAKLIERYGSLLLAWIQGIDRLQNGNVSEHQFVSASEAAGFTGDAKKLFHLMRPDKGHKLICLEDFDPRAHIAFMRGDFRMIKAKEEDEAMKSHQKPTEMTFLERQADSFKLQVQRAYAVAEREEFAKYCRLQNPDFVIDTKEEFEALCIRKHGSMIGAWRNCLDYDKNGKLTFGEFCHGLRLLGYRGDFRALYQQFDVMKRGHISLMEIDPEAHELVSTFLKLLSERYEHLDRAWKEGFHKDPHEALDEKELVKACEALGYPFDTHKLFRCLQPVPGRPLITIWDLDPMCTRLRQRGQIPYITQPRSPISAPGKKKMGFGEEDRGSSRASASHSERRTKVVPGDELSLLARVPLSQQLRTSLTKKYGSTVAAWRQAMDPDIVGTVAFGKFCVVCENSMFTGNAKGTWQEICGEKGRATFRDIDPAAAEVLDDFREQLLKRFGNIVQAWKGLGGIGRKGVSEAAFVQVCGSLEVKKPKALYHMLLGSIGQSHLVRRDLTSLLIGVPADECPTVWFGIEEATARMGSVPSQAAVVPAQEENERAEPAVLVTTDESGYGEEALTEDGEAEDVESEGEEAQGQEALEASKEGGEIDPQEKDNEEEEKEEKSEAGSGEHEEQDDDDFEEEDNGQREEDDAIPSPPPPFSSETAPDAGENEDDGFEDDDGTFEEGEHGAAAAEANDEDEDTFEDDND